MSDYCADLDVVLCGVNKQSRFTWDARALPRDLAFGTHQTNTVIMVHAIGRVYGGVMTLCPDQIDYRLFSESADPKFKSQRSLLTDEPSTRNLIYLSGGMLCVGGQMPLKATTGLFKAVAVMENYRWQGSPQFVLGRMRIVNCVYAGEFGYMIMLPILATLDMYGVIVRYEPDLFSGVFLTPTNVGDDMGTTTIFASGRFILAGTSTREQVIRAVERLREIDRTMGPRMRVTGT